MEKEKDFRERFKELTGISWKNLPPISKVDELIIEDLVDKEDLDGLEEILSQYPPIKEESESEDKIEDDLGIPQEKWWEEEDKKSPTNIPEMPKKINEKLKENIKEKVKNITKYIFLFTAISLPFIYKYLNKYLFKTIYNGKNTRKKEFEESDGEILEL